MQTPPLLELPKTRKLLHAIANRKKINYNDFVMKAFVINGSVSLETKQFLRTQGRLIEAPRCALLPPPEQGHADLQFTKIDDRTLVCAPGLDYEALFRGSGIRLVRGETPLGNAYPENIPYNVLKAGRVYFHNPKYTDPLVRKMLLQSGYSLCTVRQGYCGCSSVSIPLRSGKLLILSSDHGILSAVRRLRRPELCAEYFTDTQKIILDGYNHGLIGGCCGFDKELGLLVYGKVGGALRELSVSYGFSVVSVFNGPLTDIGGILVMYPDQPVQG